MKTSNEIPRALATLQAVSRRGIVTPRSIFDKMLGSRSVNFVMSKRVLFSFSLEIRSVLPNFCANSSRGSSFFFGFDLGMDEPYSAFACLSSQMPTAYLTSAPACVTIASMRCPCCGHNLCPWCKTPIPEDRELCEKCEAVRKGQDHGDDERRQAQGD